MSIDWLFDEKYFPLKLFDKHLPKINLYSIVNDLSYVLISFEYKNKYNF